jgi:hypothetical protein
MVIYIEFEALKIAKLRVIHTKLMSTKWLPMLVVSGGGVQRNLYELELKATN